MAAQLQLLRGDLIAPRERLPSSDRSSRMSADQRMRLRELKMVFDKTPFHLLLDHVCSPRGSVSHVKVPLVLSQR